MVSAGRHPKNAINAALDSLDHERFAVEEVHKGHRWGVLRCLACGMTEPIWSTPRVPENTARAIRRFATNHDH